MKTMRSWLALALCALLLLTVPIAAEAAGGPLPFAVQAEIDGRAVTLRAYYDSYPGNLYLSLRDLSQALNGSSRQFSVQTEISASDGEMWTVTRGQAAGAENATGETAGRPYALGLNLRRNRLFVDGGERRYYSYRADDRDLYLSLADVQMMLDFTVERREDGSLLLLPDQPFMPDPYALREEDYFGAFNAVLVGDADTEEILFSCNRAWRYPIASLSKLMSYLLVAEGVEAQQCRWQDEVAISQKAAEISWSADGVVSLSPGATYPLEELTLAMMIASSNESAQALAEHLAGSEEAFVQRMNERAGELGLLSARFYTPHGLPDYSDSSLPGKRQNAMSAEDLFHLSVYLLRECPALTEMTEKQFVTLEKLGFTTANSNPLVFNLPGVNGLKTGSTNRAGYCLVATLPVTVGEETHTLVAVVLGAESADLRGQGAELLLRWARRYYEENGFDTAETP